MFATFHGFVVFSQVVARPDTNLKKSTRIAQFLDKFDI